MNQKTYTEKLEDQIRKQTAYDGYDFWNHQDTFKKESLPDIVEHGMNEKFTPQQLATRLLEIVGR